MATAPRPVRGWVNELILVPAWTVVFFAPLGIAVALAGRYVHPGLGVDAPLGLSIVIVGFLGAYAFAVYRVRGDHDRVHGRYP